MENPVIVILGPTATGKTSLGVALARIFNGEIISVDSRQLYRGLDLGTGKDLQDFQTGGEPVPYHLIDVVEPNDEYHLFKYIHDARDAIEDIQKRGKIPFLVGGTPLYLNALLNGYELQGSEPDEKFRAALEEKSTEELLIMLKDQSPEYFERTDKNNRRRIIRSLEIVHTSGATPPETFAKIDALIIAPYYERKIVHERIAMRLQQRFDEGMVEEVARLYENGVSWERLDWFGLEYRYIAKLLKGEMLFDEMFDKLLIQIRKFCKRQDIWFRKMEREGKEIHWIPNGNVEKAKELINLRLAGKELPKPKIILNNIDYGQK